MTPYDQTKQLDNEIREFYATECNCDERDSDCLTKCVDEGDIYELPDYINDECKCAVDDKECLHSCVDDTDPCSGDRDCDDARSDIKDECECYSSDDICLSECIKEAMDVCRTDCVDQDYKCLSPCFDPSNKLTIEPRQSLSGGKAGSLSAGGSVGIVFGSIAVLGVIGMFVNQQIKKRRENN